MPKFRKMNNTMKESHADLAKVKGGAATCAMSLNSRPMPFLKSCLL